MRVVVALGGNALLGRGKQPAAAVRLEHVVRAAPALAKIAAEHEMVLVHGSGPQLASLAGPDLPSEHVVDGQIAQAQGLIGSWLQQALANAGLTTPVVTLVTQTVVDAADPAFGMPSKLIGPGYDESRAQSLARTHGWVLEQHGEWWRRVVAAPRPRRVVEIETARQLLRAGTTVVLGGGGGVPVLEGPDGLRGVDAIVDKDLVAGWVATALHADLLVILTDVEGVETDFGSDRAQTVRNISTSNLRAMTFPRDSMGPKVLAACDFVDGTGGRAAIGSLEAVGDVITGSAGTHVHT